MDNSVFQRCRSHMGPGILLVSFPLSLPLYFFLLPHASYAFHMRHTSIANLSGSKTLSKPCNQATGLMYIMFHLCLSFCRRLQSSFWSTPWRQRVSVRRPRQHMPRDRPQTKLPGQLPPRQKLSAYSCDPADPGDVCGHTHLCRGRHVRRHTTSAEVKVQWRLSAPTPVILWQSSLTVAVSMCPHY